MYSDQQILAFTTIIRDALKRHGWNQTKAAEMCGVSQTFVNTLTHTITPQVGSYQLGLVLVGLDISLHDVMTALGVDERVKRHIQDPELAKHYPNYQKLTNGQNDLDKLLTNIPPERRELARAIILAVIDTFEHK